MKLRALEINDLPFLYQWENDAASWADSDIHNPLSQKLLREYIESSSGDIYKDGQVRLVLTINAADQEGQMQCAAGKQTIIAPAINHHQKELQVACGVVDLFDFDPRARKAAIGLYIAPEYRQMGIAHHALQLLEDYAFGFLSLHQIYAIIAVDNISCIRLFSDFQYTPTVRMKDWVLRSGKYVDAILFQKICKKERVGEY